MFGCRKNDTDTAAIDLDKGTLTYTSQHWMSGGSASERAFPRCADLRAALEDWKRITGAVAVPQSEEDCQTGTLRVAFMQPLELPFAREAVVVRGRRDCTA